MVKVTRPIAVVLAEEPNATSGYIIANNIISDSGDGDIQRIWGRKSTSSLRFEHGSLPENPPLTEVIIQGNLIYDTDHDQPQVNNGVPRRELSRYPTP